jgi:segregation and condensation protein B
MSSSPEPPFDPQSQGISLDELAAAFAQVMGAAPGWSAQAAEGGATESRDVPEPSTKPDSNTTVGEVSEPNAAAADDACPISPQTILEAMLFVGNRENRPLSLGRAAELMRDVTPEEIPELVGELNARYAARGAAYEIVGEGDGYRLTLRQEMSGLRNRFFGRVREARLSQAAIDVLALVAYRQPLSAEEIARMRGRPSNHVLAHLVRRGLLRIERLDSKRRTAHYFTTDRFLRLFNLASLEDLPRSEDTPP